MVEMIETIATKEIISGDLKVNTIKNLAGTGKPDFTQGIEISNGKNIVFGTSTGTKIGTASNQKIGFFGDTPVVQASAIADPASDTAGNNAAIDSILAMLRTYGLIET